MTVEEYAKPHELSIETVRRYIRSGKLNAKRSGRSYVILDTHDNTHNNTDNTNDNTRDLMDDTHDNQTQQLLAEKDARIVQLEALLKADKQHVERLEAELSESRQRSDSIIMQLSLTLEKQQSQIHSLNWLIEDLRQPKSFWQRLFQRHRKPEESVI